MGGVSQITQITQKPSGRVHIGAFILVSISIRMASV